jgi:hypothetical protein
VGSDYDRSATFRDYHTSAVMQREHRGLENPLNPLVAARVEDAIRADLREGAMSRRAILEWLTLLLTSQSAVQRAVATVLSKFPPA